MQVSKTTGYRTERGIASYDSDKTLDVCFPSLLNLVAMMFSAMFPF